MGNETTKPLFSTNMLLSLTSGRMAEWFNALPWKGSKGVKSPSRVRISFLPQ